MKGISPHIDEEAERVVKSAHSFKPASQRGRAVRVKRVLPIIFKLDPEKKNPDNTRLGIIIVQEIQNLDSKFKVEANYTNGEWFGKVYDEETGEELPGANIVVAGGTIGTHSAMDGSFRIKVEESNDVIVSFVGYQNIKLRRTK
ncbi:MAG: carboxypeptidase-like regulatory domain-containing protein [Cyclobacteriaceae bacterium]